MMSDELLAKLDEWHEEDEFQEIRMQSRKFLKRKEIMF